MNWKIFFSKKSKKFLSKNQATIDVETATQQVINAIDVLFNGSTTVSVDIKFMKGSGWEGCHRIRIGKVRLIALFDPNEFIVKVFDIDFRGNVYK